MSKIDNGGPAFPCKSERREPCGPEGWVRVTPEDMPGMTLRDYFAAQAMQALIAALASQRPEDWLESDQWAPRQAYEVADAMLEARK